MVFWITLFIVALIVPQVQAQDSAFVYSTGACANGVCLPVELTAPAPRAITYATTSVSQQLNACAGGVCLTAGATPYATGPIRRSVLNVRYRSRVFARGRIFRGRLFGRCY